MDAEEKIAINNKWIGVQKETDYSGVIRVLVVTGAVILLILAVSLFWIVKLKHEVAIRKKTQEELKAAKEDVSRRIKPNRFSWPGCPMRSEHR
jgi:hypothetical protein